MDNPNPVALSLEEVKEQNNARSKRSKSRSLWVSDWTPYFTQWTSKSSASVDVSAKHGATCISDIALERDSFDASEVFALIRNLTDPEHPLTLEQLSVVSPDLIAVDDAKSTVQVQFTPTIPHCSQATLIGLMIRVKLSRCLPNRFKIDVRITPGAHNTEDAINKQLNDKERVAAALENPSVLRVINRGVADTEETSCWSIL